MYEYKCASCGTVFEVIQKFSDQPLREHPGCGGVVERLISAPALQFKGTGWYVTDYGKNGSSNTDKAKTTSTDSKPADSKQAAATKESTTPTKSE